jgi:uncharacterized protein (TIGR03382 family)
MSKAKRTVYGARGCGALGIADGTKSSWAIALLSMVFAVRRREAEEETGVCVTIPSRRAAAVP